MNPYVRAVFGGLIGGLVGAGIWAAISYFSHREVGWIAWGVGGLAGLGVRFFAREHDGAPYGFIAIGVAIFAILFGKFLAVSLIVRDVQKEIDQIAVTITDEDMIASKAEEVAREWKAKGRPVTTSNNPADEAKGNYSPAVMAEAAKRWKAVPAAERAKQMAELKANIDRVKAEFGGMARDRGFASSFSPFDILWFLLAAITAFKLGSGMATSE